MSSQSASRPRTRTRGFSGCWTCRAKHLKCDELKPVCNRCQQAGRECEGYGVRLNWTSVRVPSNFGKRGSRRGRLTPLFEVSRFHSRPRPSEQDEDSENPSGDSVTAATEISAVQDVQPQSDKDASHIDTAVPFLEHLNAGASVHTRDSHASTEASPGLSTEDQHQSQAQHDLFTSAGFDTIDVDYSEIRHLDPSSTTSLQPHNQLSLHVHSLTTNSSQLRLLDSLPDPGLRSRFIQHFVVFLCDVLIPIPGIENPLRTIFVPIALEGARTNSKECTGATAVFHLICAASAFHLSQSENESKHALESAALEHYNLGISHISQNIQSDDRNQSVAILASFIMAVMIEVVTVPTPFWRLHMKGAVEWVNHIEPQVWLRTDDAAKVYQTFMGMTAFIESQLLLTDCDALWETTCDMASQLEPYWLDRIFGLPEPLFKAFSAINMLQRQLKIHTSQGNRQNTDQFTESIDRLELELSLCAPSKPPESSTNHPDLMCHHAYIYYFAMLIHMKRAIRNLPLEDVQPLIEESLVHIEVFGTSINETFSPLMWTIATIAFDACEERIQRRILVSLEKLGDQSQLVVWRNLVDWVKEIWDLRKIKGNENLKWHDSWPFCENHRFMMF